jgi:hypothetical protein
VHEQSDHTDAEAKAGYLAHFNAKHVLSVNCAALAPERSLRAFYASQELKPPPVQGERLDLGDIVAAGSFAGGRKAAPRLSLRQRATAEYLSALCRTPVEELDQRGTTTARETREVHRRV